MDAETFVARLAAARVIPVVRRLSAGQAVALSRAILAGGGGVIEVTMESGDGPEAIARIREAVPDILVGAGTVTTVEQAEAAARAGAQFLVCPHYDPALIRAAASLNLPIVPGILTPSEAMTGYREGVRLFKLFPASLVGPGYIRELRGPFPWFRCVPTGGITAENARAYIEAGAVAVGVGSWLLQGDVLARGDWDTVAARVSALRRACE
jgi:2-dehydro-3-deoxyphosphogluconate aldolase/(4S)-4-hydroxy-2-oxoglutarate aldolase